MMCRVSAFGRSCQDALNGFALQNSSLASRPIWTIGRQLLLAASILALILLASKSDACPFCSSVAMTFTEEIETTEAVVLATLEEAPPVPEVATPANAPLPKAKFRVSKVIKGSEFVESGQLIEVLFFGEADKSRPYLIMGSDAPQIMWSTPLGLSKRAEAYVLKLGDLPEDASRLEFFQEYLEDEDEMLARDAYDEFAKTPYEGVIALKDKMHHDRLIAWIKDKDIPASRRRLYFTMLGVCGTRADAPLLQSMMTSDDRRTKAGLDAMIACYLILTGKDGLAEVEDRFLKDATAEYADTYAAIMAIRFHGNDTDVIEKQRLIEALRHLLARPELADLVIPDLARWKDWDVMPRMVQLFKDADEKSSWVRVPVINYLRSCPLPEAKQHIAELAKIDAEAVRRAETFFPFDSEGDGGAAEKEDSGKARPSDSEKEAADKVGMVEPESAILQPVAPAPRTLLPPLTVAQAKLLTDRPSLMAATKVSHHLTAARAAPRMAYGSNGSEPLADASSEVSASSPGSSNSSADGPDVDEAVSRAFQPSAKRTLVRRLDANASMLLESTLPVPNRAFLWGVPVVLGLALVFVYQWILGVPMRLDSTDSNSK